MGRRKVTASLKSDNCVLFEDLIRLIYLKLKSIDGDEIDAFKCINNELNKERRITVKCMTSFYHCLLMMERICPISLSQRC